MQAQDTGIHYVNCELCQSSHNTCLSFDYI